MPNEKPQQEASSLSNKLKWCGVTAFASALETSTLHPIDTTTKRIQTNPAPFYSWNLSFSANLKAMNQVLFKDTANQSAAHKFASLYRGYPQALGYKFLQRGALALQPPLKKAMESHLQTHSYWIDLGSGIIIGSGEALFLLPLDYYKTIAQTRETAIAETPRKSSLTAFGPTLARNVTFITSMSVVTDTVTRFLVKNGLFASSSAPQTAPNDTQKHTARALGVGAATIISNPLDVIKTRMQAQAAENKKTAWQLGKETLAKEGASAFLKGLVPKTLTQSARLTFFFGVQEALLNKFMPENPVKTKAQGPKT